MTDTPTGSGLRRRFIAGLIGLGIVSCILHGTHLAFLERMSFLQGVPFCEGPDTPAYFRSMQALRGAATFDPVYRERILLPWLMNICDRALGDVHAVLWLVVLLELPATMAVGYLARVVSGRYAIGLVGGALYVMYPDTYQYGVWLQTDVIHAQLAVSAAALTVLFMRSSVTATGLLAAACWMLTQLTRPTFFFVIIGLLGVCWERRREPGLRRRLLGLSLATLVVPAGFSCINWRTYGVPAPSLCQAEMLYTWTAPRVRTFLENVERPAPVTQLFYDDVNATRTTAVWQAIHGNFATSAEFRRRYREAIGESSGFLVAHWAVTLETSVAALCDEILTIPRYHNPVMSSALNGIYPEFKRPLRIVYKSGLLLAVVGVLLALGSPRRDVVILLGAMALLILGPASLSWWCGGRYRFNVDVLLLPMLAMALGSSVGWAVLGAVFLVGYLPQHLLHLPEAYLPFVIIIALLVTTAAVYLRNRPPEHARDGLESRL